MAATALAVQCHDWRPHLDGVWCWSDHTASVSQPPEGLCGWSEQPPKTSSIPESRTALVWLIVFASWQNSLAQVKPYMGTITVTPRQGISPHSLLHGVDVPTSALNFCCHYPAHEESWGHIALEWLHESDTDTTLPVVMLCSMTFTLPPIIIALGFFPPAVMPYLAPSGFCALVRPSFRWNATYKNHQRGIQSCKWMQRKPKYRRKDFFFLISM